MFVYFSLQIFSALRSPCMQALETEYSPVLTGLEKMASLFPKFVNLQNSPENAQQNAQQNASVNVPKKNVLAPIYDGSDLELIDEEGNEEDRTENKEATRTPSNENPGRNFNHSASLGNTNSEGESHNPLRKTVSIAVPQQVIF